MPTYTVGPGKTYATITLAVAAIPSNLAGTGIHEVVIDAGLYSLNLANVTVGKSNGSATDYIHFKAATGSEHRGIVSAGVRCQTDVAIEFWVVTTAYTRFTNIITNSSLSGGSWRMDAPNCTLKNCIVFGGFGDCFNCTANGLSTKFICCLVICGASGNAGFYLRTDCKVYNCGVIGPATGYIQSISGSTGVEVFNSWAWPAAGGKTFNAVSGSNWGGSDYNWGNDTFVPGAHSVLSGDTSTLHFVNSGSNDFHILETSALKNTGFDFSSIFTTDFDDDVIAAWPIGPDFPPVRSLSVGGANALLKPWPSFSITPAIQWIQDSAGYWNGSDRGAAQDAYEATAVFHGREPAINSLEQSLDANREAITLSNFAAPLFAPNVDHTGSIQAVVLGYTRRQVQWGAPYATHQIYELEVRFRAIAPTLLATTPSWATLRLQDGFRAEHSHESPKAFTYAQTAVYGDHASDTGTFEASFSQKTAELQAILAYLLGTARASAVAFPATVATTVPYPWGRARGTATNCKVLSFECSRKNLNRWALSLKLVEAP